MTSPWKCADLKPSVLDAWLARSCGDTNLHVGRLHDEQLKRLRQLLVYVQKHSRFYQKKISNVDAASFSLEDLPHLPFTTPADIVQWQDFLCVSQSNVARMVTLHTSGTSGPPKRIAVTRRDLAATKDFFQIGMSQLVDAGQRALVLWPGAERPHGVSALLTEALQENGVQVVQGNPSATMDTLQEDFLAHNPHVVVALPKQLSTLSNLLLNKDNLHLGTALRGILSSGEGLDEAVGQDLYSSRKCLILDHYGMTETGYGGGVECLAHKGYHLRALDLLVEVVDIVTGQPLPFLTDGEVVVTTLTREAMPLVRYRTGDVASLLPEPCPCGSPMPRLSRIKGRIQRTGNTYKIIQIDKGMCHVPLTQPSL